MDFSGRHVVITGGSTGIGRATAEIVAARGGKVSLIARSADRLAEAEAAIGAAASSFPADVADKAQLLAALDAAVARHRAVDGLFLNAGNGGSFAPVADYDETVYDAVLAVNLKAPFLAIAHLLPAMAERGRGAILVTGSLASERGMANNVAYVVSKHGVLGLSRAVALEAAASGVRCNCLVPGFIETPMLERLPPDAFAALAAATPQGRIGTAAEVGEVAAFLLSDAAGHVTGQCWAVDGGMLGTLKI
jgi:NAD(P)-dependent dehydrogenase (short-subunit alcohol dehydrogenase family)